MSVLESRNYRGRNQPHTESLRDIIHSAFSVQPSPQTRNFHDVGTARSQLQVLEKYLDNSTPRASDHYDVDVPLLHNNNIDTQEPSRVVREVVAAAKQVGLQSNFFKPNCAGFVHGFTHHP